MVLLFSFILLGLSNGSYQILLDLTQEH